MSRIKDDLNKDIILEELTNLLLEINERMLFAPKGEKLPSQKDLGILLGERLQRQRAFSDRAINTYMKIIKYKSNHHTKQYEKDSTFKISGYVADPSLVYLPITDNKDRKKIIEWAHDNFPQTYEDSIDCNNGIIIIGNTSQFSRRFIKRYDEYAKENDVKLKTPDLEEPSL